MVATGVSPSSSPRLPSPPPFTEVQIGSKSPSIGETFGTDAEQLLGASLAESEESLRRIRPGTKAADMAFGPPLVPLSQLDSPFQLQEHLKALYNHCTKPDDSNTTMAINHEAAARLATAPEGVDRSLWLYELCRFLTMKVNNLIVAFFADDPPCSSQTCPEMRASEWQYLCAVHDPPKSCCAIDYCCHTLDWATNILTSPKHFPSRLTLGSPTQGGPQASMRHLTNIFRRLYRIFAHAWFQHRGVFWQVEVNDGLYIFFKTVCDMYSLIPDDNYTIPAEAEGEDAQQAADGEEAKIKRRLTILRKADEDSQPPPPFNNTDAAGATTRRHKHTPSTPSRVMTIAESAEDVEDNRKSSPPIAEEKYMEKEPDLSAEDATGLDVKVQDTDGTNQEVSEEQEISHEPSESRSAEAYSSEPQATGTLMPMSQSEDVNAERSICETTGEEGQESPEAASSPEGIIAEEHDKLTECKEPRLETELGSKLHRESEGENSAEEELDYQGQNEDQQDR